MQALDEEVKAAGITVMNEIGVSRNNLGFTA
jgi:saccharopine dehydrogenase-like NADP-dependent oxidoreductase